MFLLLTPTAVVPWRWAVTLSGEEQHRANRNPKRSLKLYLLQDTFPTTENAGHQSSSTKPGLLVIAYKHHFTSYFSSQILLSIITPVHSIFFFLY